MGVVLGECVLDGIKVLGVFEGSNEKLLKLAGPLSIDNFDGHLLLALFWCLLMIAVDNIFD